MRYLANGVKANQANEKIYITDMLKSLDCATMFCSMKIILPVLLNGRGSNIKEKKCDISYSYDFVF